MEIYYIVPLCNALIYTLGALCLKRSTNDGVGPWRTTFFSNLTLFAVALPFWFVGPPLESWTALLVPLGISGAFFAGQLLGCLAIHKGDVSLVTPLMGTKPVFVALVVSVAMGESLTLPVWIGAVLSSVAILLMRGGSVAEKRRVLPSIVLGLLCSFFYALNDALMQRYGGRIGFEQVMAGTFSFVMLWSLLLIPMFRSPMSAISGKAWAWLGAGTGLMACQATAMAWVLSTHGRATVVNVLYSSRGIWSVALVWVVGHWFSNTERDLGGAVLLKRLIGSLLLVAAIVAVVNR